MKTKNKIIILTALILVVTCCISTYACYKSSASGNVTANVASWSVKVDNTNIVESDTLVFDENAIVW